MAYDLAAQMPDVIAAIAVVSATAGIRPVESPHVLTIPEPSAPVPLIGFHGVKDGHIPYDGGEGKRTRDILAFIPASNLLTSGAGQTGAAQTLSEKLSRTALS